MTVAGTAAGTVAVSVAGTAGDSAGDSAADSAAGTAPITNLIDFQIYVSDLLSSITLLTFLSEFPHHYMLILIRFYKHIKSGFISRNLTRLLQEC